MLSSSQSSIRDLELGIVNWQKDQSESKQELSFEELGATYRREHMVISLLSKDVNWPCPLTTPSLSIEGKSGKSYRIFNSCKLGEGKSSKIYLAFDDNNSPYAVRTIKQDELFRLPNWQKLITLNIEHPNLSPPQDLCENQNHILVFSNYHKGISLAEVLEMLEYRKGIKSEESIEFCSSNRINIANSFPKIEGNVLDQFLSKIALVTLCQISKGMSYLHSKFGFSHGDMSPPNLQITNNGQNAKLIDWEIADNLNGEANAFLLANDILFFGLILKNFLNCAEPTYVAKHAKGLANLADSMTNTKFKNRPTANEAHEEFASLLSI